MRNLLVPVLLCGALLTPACTSSSERTLKALEALKKKQAEAKKEAETEKLAPLPVDVVQLDPPWDDGSSVRLIADGPCPANFWALFPGDVPGDTREDKKANAAQRKELAAAFKGKQYLVKLRAPDQVTLEPYDAPKGHFPLSVIGSIDCTDDMGSVTIAWTAAKAVDPGASAAKQGQEVTQNIWQAPKMNLTMPGMSMAQAKEFESKQKLALSGRIVFTLGKVAVDKKLKRVAKVEEEAAGEKLSFGGGTEDWGAGRMVRAELVGLRVATDSEKTQVLVERPNK